MKNMINFMSSYAQGTLRCPEPNKLELDPNWVTGPVPES